MGLAQQLAEFDPAAMALDERQVDLALLLAETGFELMPPNGNQRLRAIPVPPAFWRPALDLCRSHLGGGERRKLRRWPRSCIMRRILLT